MGTSKGLTDEHFVPVENYPLYVVSNFGRVINVKTGNELVQKQNKMGDLIVGLYSSGTRQVFLVGRLVAKAFFVDFTEENTVRFLNKNKLECTVMNITLKENA